MKNLFRDIPDDLSDEFFELLLKTGDVEIERIVSGGHSSPASGWYDQDRAEFVLLLKGSACLQFEDKTELSLVPGDWLEIPAHKKHRVAWTEKNTETVWLAVHYL